MTTLKKVLGRNTKEGTQLCFNSVSEASNYLNLDKSHIRQCINGTRKSHGGYSWSYERISKEKIKILSEIKKTENHNLGDLKNTDDLIFGDLNFSPEMWTKEEDILIQNHYPSGKLSDLLNLLGSDKDIKALTCRARILGIKRGFVPSKNRSADDLFHVVIDLKNEVFSI